METKYGQCECGYIGTVFGVNSVGFIPTQAQVGSPSIVYKYVCRPCVRGPVDIDPVEDVVWDAIQVHIQKCRSIRSDEAAEEIEQIMAGVESDIVAALKEKGVLNV